MENASLNPSSTSAITKQTVTMEAKLGDNSASMAGKDSTELEHKPLGNTTNSSSFKDKDDEQLINEGEFEGSEATEPPGQVTEEEIRETIEAAKSTIALIIENYTFQDYIEDEVFNESLTRSYSIYFQFQNLPPLKAVQSRREIGNFIVEKGGVPILVTIVKDILSKGWIKEDGEENLRLFCLLYYSFGLIFNYSESAVSIAEASANVSGFLEFLREQLTAFYPNHLDMKNFSTRQHTILSGMLGFIHNVANEDSARKRLHDLDFTSVLIPYLQSPVDGLKMTALLALADLVNEKESEIINSSIEAVQFLLRSLEKAIKDPHRRHVIWCATELARGIGRLAANDSNKKMLVSEGALPLLHQLCCIGDPDDQCEAAGAVWALSFDDDNKDCVLNEPGLLDQLITLSKSPDIQVNKPAQGVLWTLRYKLKDKQGYKEIGEELIHGRQDITSHGSDKFNKINGLVEENCPHVMISYQWGSQPVLLRVRDFLKTKGYKTWIDVDYMGGSTLQAMAEAVENSAVILICMSHKYKDSPNCRAEAEYAFQRRVPIVPLLMEENYRPDGWLGILLGSKLFYDFSGKYKFETRVAGLLKELGDKGLASNSKNKPPGKPTISKPKDEVYSGPKACSKNTSREISKWGKSEVGEWLKKQKIQKSTLLNLTGKELIFLHNLKREAPETFYLLLRSNLELNSLHELMTFVEVLEELL